MNAATEKLIECPFQKVNSKKDKRKEKEESAPAIQLRAPGGPSRPYPTNGSGSNGAFAGRGGPGGRGGGGRGGADAGGRGGGAPRTFGGRGAPPSGRPAYNGSSVAPRAAVPLDSNGGYAGEWPGASTGATDHSYAHQQNGAEWSAPGASNGATTEQWGDESAPTNDDSTGGSAWGAPSSEPSAPASAWAPSSASQPATVKPAIRPGGEGGTMAERLRAKPVPAPRPEPVKPQAPTPVHTAPLPPIITEAPSHTHVAQQLENLSLPSSPSSHQQQVQSPVAAYQGNANWGADAGKTLLANLTKSVAAQSSVNAAAVAAQLEKAALSSSTLSAADNQVSAPASQSQYSMSQQYAQVPEPQQQQVLPQQQLVPVSSEIDNMAMTFGTFHVGETPSFGTGYTSGYNTQEIKSDGGAAASAAAAAEAAAQAASQEAYQVYAVTKRALITNCFSHRQKDGLMAGADWTWAQTASRLSCTVRSAVPHSKLLCENNPFICLCQSHASVEAHIHLSV